MGASTRDRRGSYTRIASPMSEHRARFPSSRILIISAGIAGASSRATCRPSSAARTSADRRITAWQMPASVDVVIRSLSTGAAIARVTSSVWNASECDALSPAPKRRGAERSCPAESHRSAHAARAPDPPAPPGRTKPKADRRRARLRSRDGEVPPVEHLLEARGGICPRGHGARASDSLARASRLPHRARWRIPQRACAIGPFRAQRLPSLSESARDVTDWPGRSRGE